MSSLCVRNLILSFTLLCLFQVIYSANVLCMFTSSIKSNIIVFMAVANTLIDRGHNVTIITTIPIPPECIGSHRHRQFRHIFLEAPVEKMRQLNDFQLKMSDESLSKITGFSCFWITMEMLTTIQRDALEQEQFQQFFREDNKFDLMILGYIQNEFMVGVAAKYGCPIAVINLGAPFGTVSQWIGNPSTTSFVQIPIFGKSQPMNIWERIQNFILEAAEPFVQVYSNYEMDNIYRSLFTDENYPSYYEVIANISLVLYNRHFSEMPIRPLVPALVEIGGIQNEDQEDSLPEDIQNSLDSSQNGAILFRVGCMGRRTELTPQQLQIVLNVLSKLDLNVLYDWERAEEPPTGYSNILFRRLITIDSVLSHANLKLFVTDGRPMIVQEAQYHGVPMVGLPIFAEEPFNIEAMTNNGFGVYLDITTLTETSFKDGIHKVLDTPSYTQKVKDFSKLFRDRPISAKETAAFWLEYVIRHRGAHHMQSPLVHMSFVKRWNIDVVAILIVGVWVAIRLVRLIVFIVRVCIDLRSQKIKKNTKYKAL